MPQTYAKCQYCGATLVAGALVCRACGAPVEAVGMKPKMTRQVGSTSLKTPSEKEAEREKQEALLKKTAGQLEGAYYFFWHSLAQIFAVGVSATALGIIGGATDMVWWGLSGAGLVGLAVGYTRKWALLEMFSAPLGLVLGSALGIILWLLFHNNAIFIFTASLGAAGLAVLGSQQQPFAYRSLWQKMRPVVGLMAALAAGTLGILIGAGIRTAVMGLLGG